MTRSTAAKTIRRLVGRAAHDAPAKVAAVLAALLLWWFASNEPGTTTQRSLLVPLAVVGADADEVAVGVPARVEVVIAGPSERMERLRSTDVEVILDLSDVDGEFSREIEARAPQALRVDRIVPAEVIGRLEAVRTARWDVLPLTAHGEDARTFDVTVDPAVVEVVARDPVMNRIVRVVVPVTDVGDGNVEGPVVPIPIDEEGRAVEEVRTIPDIVDVRVTSREALTSKVVPVVVRSDAVPDRIVVTGVDRESVTVIGTARALRDLDAVTVTLPAFLRSLAPGRYAVAAPAVVPDGVAVLENVDVRIEVTAASTPMGR